MSVKPEPGKDVPESPAEKAASPEISNQETNTPAFTTMLFRGVERFADLQKLTLDVLNRQTKDIKNTVREVLRASPGAPGTVFLDLTEQAVEDWLSAQKGVLDLMVQQSNEALEGAKAGTNLAAQSVADVMKMLQQSAQRTIAAQEITLAFAVLQQAGIFEMVKRQTGVEETPFAAATYSMQRSLESLVAKQQEFLGETAKALGMPENRLADNR